MILLLQIRMGAVTNKLIYIPRNTYILIKIRVEPSEEEKIGKTTVLLAACGINIKIFHNISFMF